MLQPLTQFGVEATTNTVEDTSHSAEEEQGIAALGIDPIAILLQAGTFLILFFLIRKFALDKIVGALDGRRQKIEESLKTAEEIEKRDRENRAETEKLLKKARSDADAVIAKAHEESGAIVKAAEEAATKRAEKMIHDSEAKIGSDIAKAKKELKDEMLSLIAEATESVIGEKMDLKKDHALLEKALRGDS